MEKKEHRYRHNHNHRSAQVENVVGDKAQKQGSDVSGPRNQGIIIMIGFSIALRCSQVTKPISDSSHSERNKREATVEVD